MKKVTFVLISVLLLAGIAFATAVSADMGHDGDSEMMSDESGLGVYACPMFDGFMTADPEARCPNCGMRTEELEELYVCPDHPDEFSVDPEMICEDTGSPYVEAEELWVCPMDPERIFASEDASCGDCDMALVPLKDAVIGEMGGNCAMDEDEEQQNCAHRCH